MHIYAQSFLNKIMAFQRAYQNYVGSNTKMCRYKGKPSPLSSHIIFYSFFHLECCTVAKVFISEYKEKLSLFCPWAICFTLAQKFLTEVKEVGGRVISRAIFSQEASTVQRDFKEGKKLTSTKTFVSIYPSQKYDTISAYLIQKLA